MEELQDAIEDIQYMDAMNDSLPKPTKRMQLLKAKELQAYMDTLHADKFSLDVVCSEYTGFYLFKRFLESTGKADGKVYVGYAIDLAAFRSTTMASKRRGLAVAIAESYLKAAVWGECPPPSSSSDKNGLRGNSEKTAPRSSSGKSDRGQEWSHTMFRRPPSIKDSQLKRVPDSASKLAEGEKETNTSKVCPVDGQGYLLKDEPFLRVQWEAYIVQVDSDTALKIVGEPLQKVLDAIEDESCDLRADLFDEIDAIIFEFIKAHFYEDFTKSEYWKKYFQLRSLCQRKLLEDDFSLYRVLGRGGFGLVNACKHGYTGKLYAMKMLNKRRVKVKKAEKLCLNERNIMATVESPYIVCLRYAFATSSDLYLILDVMTGGDLGFHLGRVGVFTLRESRYYAARIVLGIAALHDLNIVFRDLKPDNILMDREGFTKLSDLGLATSVGPHGISGCCGTRGYWAPEMVRKNEQGKRDRYGLAVDWFSLGCVLYEFVFGISPFRTDRGRTWGSTVKSGLAKPVSVKELSKADKDASIDKAILEMEPDWPEFADANVLSLLQALLTKDPKQRLGGGLRGARDIMAHPFFSEIDWGAIETMSPPIRPSIDINTASQSDIGVFADEAEYKKVILTEDDQAVYKDWDFVSQKNYQMELVEFMMIEEKTGPIRADDGMGGCCAVA